MEEHDRRLFTRDEIAKLFVVSPEAMRALENSPFYVARRWQREELEQLKAEVAKWISSVERGIGSGSEV